VSTHPGNPLLDALHAEGPDATHAEALSLYGQFVGSWRVENTDHHPDGGTHFAIGEWHFGWVLQGRAIQDVWITPARGTDPATLPPNYMHRYGTTLRMYLPEQRCWRILWTDPAIGFSVSQTAREENGDIIQIGATTKGVPMRWSFRDITRDRFRWIGEISDDGGKTWRLQLEMRATRTA
jgi:hypothetical protein